MKLIKVDKDPRLMKQSTHRFRNRHDNLPFIQAFLASGAKFAKVEFAPGEYSDVTSARSALAGTVRTYKLPVEIITRDSVIYFCRDDL
jgi:hypothetical protein